MSVFKSVLSFKPLVKTWEAVISEGQEGVSELYASLLKKVQQHPELLEPITNDEILEKHKSLVNQMMATVFPITLSSTQDLYAIGLPFQHKIIYASAAFRKMFTGKAGQYIQLPDQNMARKLDDEKLAGAYQLILDKFYNIRIEGMMTSVHPYKCPESGLDQFMELEIDTRFIDVISKSALPPLPPHCRDCYRMADLRAMPELAELLPLENFEFHGMVIVRIKEVTHREVINKIKNSLLHIHTFADEEVFRELQVQIRNLLGVDSVHTAIKPFFKVNNHLVLSDLMTTSEKKEHYNNIPLEKKQELHRQIEAAFNHSPDILVIDRFDEETLFRYPFLVMLHELGFKNAIICPLFTEEKELAGMLVIASFEEGVLTTRHAARIEATLPLFTLALEKSQEHLD
ncbi:MAG TPA: hypothetical protein VD996_08310, partial [Chitinophagaceae bacterium]|nr:hypothetical protein [Chitinophagaceae bacterium]